MFLACCGKLALSTAKPFQLVLALHVPFQRALPRGRKRAVRATVGLAFVHRQLVIFEIVLSRRLKWTLDAGVLGGQVNALDVPLEVQLPLGAKLAEVTLVLMMEVGSYVIGQRGLVARGKGAPAAG